jgi:predicted RNA methylase
VKNGAKHYQGQIFEPTAGNGMMTIAFRPEQCTVNEIDDTRYKNLLTQGFRKATQINAIYNTPNEKFDGVITNPPFGSVDQRDYLKIDNKYILKDLDHILSYYALNNLNPMVDVPLSSVDTRIMTVREGFRQVKTEFS